MKSKLIAACMALAAFAAFGVAATSASAATLTSSPGGPALATGTKLQATNLGKTIMTNTAHETLIECETAKMTGTLETNSGGNVAGTISTSSFEGTGAGGDCTTSTGASVKITTGITGGLPYCIKNTKEDNFEVRGGSCPEAARSIKYTMDFTNGGTCGFEKSNLTGTFTTESTGDAIFTSNNQGNWKRFELSLGFESIFCPSEATLDMAFTLETDPASGSASPIYIS